MTDFSKEDILNARAICAEKGMELTPRDTLDILQALARHLADSGVEADSADVLEFFCDMPLMPPNEPPNDW
jgi:hypothetical protein